MLKKIKSFLFENKTDSQIIIKNTFWLILAEGISKWSMFLITILIAKNLWPEQFWILSFVMSFVSIFIVITDFGLITFMVREVSKDYSKIKAYLINLSFLKIVLWIITFILVWVVSQFIWKSDFYITLILIYCSYAIINNFWEFIRAFFRPSENMQYEALFKIINWFLMLTIVLSTLFIYWSLKSIFYGYLIAWVISLFISLFYVLNKLKINKLKLKKKLLLNSLKSGLYIGLWIFFISLYMSIDQVMLWLYNKIEDLWIYALAYKFTMIYWLITWVIFSNFLPRINKNNYLFDIKNNYLKWIKIILKYNIILFLFIEIFIYILFGNNLFFIEYSNFYTVLSILITFYLFEPLWYWWYINILSLRKDKFNFISLWITAIINIVWNIILIPDYSYYWAIFTTILSYFIYFLFTYFYLTWWERRNIKEIL